MQNIVARVNAEKAWEIVIIHPGLGNYFEIFFTSQLNRNSGEHCCELLHFIQKYPFSEKRIQSAKQLELILLLRPKLRRHCRRSISQRSS